MPLKGLPLRTAETRTLTPAVVRIRSRTSSTAGVPGGAAALERNRVISLTNDPAIVGTHPGELRSHVPQTLHTTDVYSSFIHNGQHLKAA